MRAVGSIDHRAAPRGRRIALWASMIALAGLLIGGTVTLPVSVAWHDVQELDAAIRHAPAWSPVVPLEKYEPRETPEIAAWRRTMHHAASWFGHDDLGRSLFFRVMPGFLVSLGVGLVAAGMAVAIGTLWGAVAAMAGGRIDMVMMRVVDLLYGLPYILMVILLKVGLTRPLSALLGGHTRVADVVILFAAIGAVGWLTMARVVRGQVLSLREQPFVEAARAAGAGPVYVFRRHIAPHLAGPIIVCATLAMPQAILQESFLSFLGIGVQQPTPSLGRLAADGVQAVNLYVDFWWLIVIPCGVLAATLLSLNFIGDAVRDRLDPRSVRPSWL